MGKNFRIGFGTDNQLQFEKYDTVAEEARGGDKKNAETEIVQEIVNNPLKKNLKLFLARNELAIEDLVSDIASPKAFCSAVNRHKEYASVDMVSKAGAERPGDWDAVKLGLVGMLQRKRNADDAGNDRNRQH